MAGAKGSGLLRKTRIGACLAAGLLLSGGAARAEIFASPPGFVDINQSQQFVCYLANIGPTSVTLSSVRIVNGPPGTSLALTVNTCGSSLAAGKICVWATTVAATASAEAGRTHACRADVSAKQNLRGSLEIRRIDSGRFYLYQSLEMR
ncbi:MAG: hypothetical protein U1E45_03610 [Geminicoccaceae bacterium]